MSLQDSSRSDADVKIWQLLQSLDAVCFQQGPVASSMLRDIALKPHEALMGGVVLGCERANGMSFLDLQI